jgi:hypothetical protein
MDFWIDRLAAKMVAGIGYLYLRSDFGGLTFRFGWRGLF